MSIGKKLIFLLVAVLLLLYPVATNAAVLFGTETTATDVKTERISGSDGDYEWQVKYKFETDKGKERSGVVKRGGTATKADCSDTVSYVKGFAMLNTIGYEGIASGAKAVGKEILKVVVCVVLAAALLFIAFRKKKQPDGTGKSAPKEKAGKGKTKPVKKSPESTAAQNVEDTSGQNPEENSYQ